MAELHVRKTHFRLLWNEGIWGKWLGLIWAIYGVAAAFKAEVLSSADQEKLQMINIIGPLLSIPLPYWVAGSCLVITIWIFEASFSLQKKNLVNAGLLKSRIEALEEKIRPKLKCSFGKDIPGCVVPTSLGGLNVTYYRVKLETDCVAHVPNCSAHLISLTRNGITLFEHESIALPIAPAERPNPTFKDILDKVPEHLDVFLITEVNKIVLVTPKFIYPASIDWSTIFSKIGEYVFHIVVSAPTTVSCEINVRLKWTGDLKTAEVSTP